MMIGIDFIGRLGNQMFTYAFARTLVTPDKEAKLFANFKRCGDHKDAGWGDQLCYFNVLPYTTESSDLVLKYGTFYQRVFYAVYVICTKVPFIVKSDALMYKIEHGLRKIGIHITGAADAAYSMSPTNKDCFVRGYFQDRHFFDSIRPILLKEFTPKSPPLAHNLELYQAISQPNSVCVSVRRGDYLSATYKKDFHVCGPDYYTNAIHTIREKVANPIFVFFSDDIQWVRANMSVPGCQCYYESGNDPVWEKLRLMYNCHHFIIPNSTFAWWAQYLGNRQGKMVICPSRWFANPNWHSNLIKDDFIFIRL